MNRVVPRKLKSFAFLSLGSLQKAAPIYMHFRILRCHLGTAILLNFWVKFVAGFFITAAANSVNSPPSFGNCMQNSPKLGVFSDEGFGKADRTPALNILISETNKIVFNIWCETQFKVRSFLPFELS